MSLWAFGKYLERALPAPFFSLAGLFMVSGVLGALASANLNVNYVACGGSAGVCGLLGGWEKGVVARWRCSVERGSHRLPVDQSSQRTTAAGPH